MGTVDMARVTPAAAKETSTQPSAKVGGDPLC
jgi:hypothetical protein